MNNTNSYSQQHRKSAVLKQLARQNLLGKYKTAIFAIFIIGAVTTALTLPFYFLIYNNNSIFATMISYIATFIISIISSMFAVGYSYMFLNMARDREYKLSDILFAFTHYADRFIIAIFILLIIQTIFSIPAIAANYLLDESAFSTIVVYGLSFVGDIASLILNLVYGLAYMIMLDDSSISPIKALNLSASMMKGQKKRAFLIVLSFIGWVILGIMSLFFGYLWIAPYMQSTMVFFYLDLMGELDSPDALLF